MIISKLIITFKNIQQTAVVLFQTCYSDTTVVDEAVGVFTVTLAHFPTTRMTQPQHTV